MRAPSRAGSIGHGARGSISVAAVSVLVVLLVVVGGLSLLTTFARPGEPAATSSSPLTPGAGPATHGDLVVASGQTFIIQPIFGSNIYYQGGNITVELGGTLIVRNVTLSFVQFVSDTGTPIQRLSHIFHFIDEGTVNLTNANLTTDVQVINAYAKLNLTIQGGVFNAWQSTLDFPGWVNVEGPTGTLTLNASTVTGNAAVRTLSEPLPTLGDTSFAPSISVTGGAKFNVLASTLTDTYADNTIFFGHPQPVPLDVSNTVLSSGDNNYTYPLLTTPTDSANLSQDWLYPAAVFEAGNLLVEYANPSSTLAATANANVWYNGTQYFVAALTFPASSGGLITLPLPQNLLNAVTQAGMLNYLNWTGSFGVLPPRISIDLSAFAGPAVNLNYAKLSLLPSPAYNMLVSDAGSVLNSIDSSFGLTWNFLPLNSTSQVSPTPWSSNKLLLSNGANAYLANATVPTPLPGVFATSAVLTDATSEAFFYRWAQFNLTGRGGFLPVVGAHVSAYYAYTTSEANNVTANALNALSTANPVIWGYVQYWDAQHGYTEYGYSNALGIASVLLASSNITLPTLPDGFFLGGYHIGISVPAVGVESQWFNWTVSPYPTGVAQSSNGLAGPDFAPTQRFNSYYGAASISAVSVTANGAASKTVNLGQTLAVKVTVEDLGTVPITQVAADLYYNATSPPTGLLATNQSTGLHLTAPGQETTLTLTWKATLNTTGINAFFATNLSLVVDWNYNTISLGGGNLTQNVSVTFAPTTLTLAGATVLANGIAIANKTVELGQTLGVQVVVQNVGNATITGVTADLYYNATSPPTGLLASYDAANLGLNSPGQQATFTLNWKATENITGLLGWFKHNLSLVFTWNANNLWLGQGTFSENVSLEFAPSQIAFNKSAFVLPPTTLNLLGQYDTPGAIEFNGSHPATLEVCANPVGGPLVCTPSSVVLAFSTSLPGPFSIPWSSLSALNPGLTPGKSYTLAAKATYNGRSTNYTFPGTYSVPPPASSPASFLFQTFLGLPLWVWLAIAGAAVVAIVLFLFVVRRQAAGKLVECGECGNLIPEDATTCPKCGAEFESDLIRCSRCASTIPANSKFCPECAAQLLGSPGEAESDPEKQAYADFTEKYRAEAKRELGDNYSEGAFWDWWKRQPTYTPFSQWSLQQGQGTPRAGMTAPPTGTETTEEPDAGRMPPKTGGGGAATPTASSTPPAAPLPSTTAAVPPAAGGAGLKACPSCGKEIPSEYLVCPFCNAVTQ